jgi:hypothetical protein
MPRRPRRPRHPRQLQHTNRLRPSESTLGATPPVAAPRHHLPGEHHPPLNTPNVQHSAAAEGRRLQCIVRPSPPRLKLLIAPGRPPATRRSNRHASRLTTASLPQAGGPRSAAGPFDQTCPPELQHGDHAELVTTTCGRPTSPPITAWPTVSYFDHPDRPELRRTQSTGPALSSCSTSSSTPPSVRATNGAGQSPDCSTR